MAVATILTSGVMGDFPHSFVTFGTTKLRGRKSLGGKRTEVYACVHVLRERLMAWSLSSVLKKPEWWG